MGWVTVLPTNKDGEVNAPIAIGVMLVGARTPKLNLRFQPIDKLEWLQKDKYVKVLQGEDEYYGRIRICPDPSSSIDSFLLGRGPKVKSGFCLQVKFPDGFLVPEKRQMTPAFYTVAAQMTYIEIKLPVGWYKHKTIVNTAKPTGYRLGDATLAATGD
jgi:hypothetical protein